MNQWEYPVRRTERRSFEPAVTLEVFTQLRDAKRFLRTIVEARDGIVSVGQMSGTYLDLQRDNIMRVWIGRRLR